MPNHVKQVTHLAVRMGRMSPAIAPDPPESKAEARRANFDPMFFLFFASFCLFRGQQQGQGSCQGGGEEGHLEQAFSSQELSPKLVQATSVVLIQSLGEMTRCYFFCHL